jgi:hypothetical protein
MVSYFITNYPNSSANTATKCEPNKITLISANKEYGSTFGGPYKQRFLHFTHCLSYKYHYKSNKGSNCAALSISSYYRSNLSNTGTFYLSNLNHRVSNSRTNLLRYDLVTNNFAYGANRSTVVWTNCVSI